MPDRTMEYTSRAETALYEPPGRNPAAGNQEAMDAYRSEAIYPEREGREGQSVSYKGRGGNQGRRIPTGSRLRSWTRPKPTA